MALAPGTKLGLYEILSPLGAGGMGEVYRGRDTRQDRTVAINICMVKELEWIEMAQLAVSPRFSSNRFAE